MSQGHFLHRECEVAYKGAPFRRDCFIRLKHLSGILYITSCHSFSHRALYPTREEERGDFSSFQVLEESQILYFWTWTHNTFLFFAGFFLRELSKQREQKHFYNECKVCSLSDFKSNSSHCTGNLFLLCLFSGFYLQMPCTFWFTFLVNHF